ncbi:MAG: hypothetical protein FWE42_06690, partial [Defluviitaleaceae bacterium]|nr:hypothetical protein [Defluviitaleaceae bacterium]
HETDITIADFVADHRAPTPTAAAQMVAYDHAQTTAYLWETYIKLHKSVKDSIITRQQEAKALLAKINTQSAYRLTLEKQKLAHNTDLLEKVSPYAAFKRGFALVKDDKGNGVISAKSLNTGQELTLQWADGQARAKVSETFLSS